MAEVCPPFSVPGLGSKVSNWLGPPCIHSRIIERPCFAELLGVHAHQLAKVERAGRDGPRGDVLQKAAARDGRLADKPHKLVMEQAHGQFFLDGCLTTLRAPPGWDKAGFAAAAGLTRLAITAWTGTRSSSSGST